ncbi:hypothetical protein APB26_34360 [Pseudomonas aeruginosa]|uniref:hypothetical protein n=1 Tax=Pseudomonas aeruginosa TaxID=287 RepID=UPI00071B414A|nr:hypothetical protein [Pseudomonas aeruginosa]OPE29617.1 hypothetical protein APB26_34360 [Pseudomonas aeruginosa]
MSLSRGKLAEVIWWAGVLVCLVGCLLMLAQVAFEAVPVGQRWPVAVLALGAVLVTAAKLLEWHSHQTAKRVVSDALLRAKR